MYSSRRVIGETFLPPLYPPLIHSFLMSANSATIKANLA